ncbi:MAG: ATP-binding protein [Chloroflexota bacterium]
MSSTLMEKLAAARRQRFVGRQSERDLFREALLAAERPFFLFYLFGSGGVGKSSLLREFAHIASQHGVRVVQLDGRTIDATPDGFLTALRYGLNVPAEAVFSALAAENGRFVLLIDTVELLHPLDGWLQETFLPQLPANMFVVMAGRNPPSPRWRSDPGWQTLMRVIPLRNLRPEEGMAYLVRRQVRANQHAAVLNFTHGHPLALSLVADMFDQSPQIQFQPENAPDVIKTVLDQFLQEVPTPTHRAALEACALVRLTSEPVLAHVLQVENGQPLFDWLRQLSFINAERRGLYPHDLAREALVADLRWRNPERFKLLQDRAQNYYMGRVQQADLREQRRMLIDFIYLHRDNPVVQPYFEWQFSGSVFVDGLRAGEETAVVNMVQRYEGDHAAELVAHWLVRQPQGVTVIRQATGAIAGFLLMVSLEKATDDDRQHDPAVDAACAFLHRHAPLKPSERATIFRFWLAAESYQSVSPAQSRIFLSMVQHYLTTPGLVYTFLPCANPAFWANVFAYADLQRLPEVDFVVGGRPYGVYGHNWRAVPGMVWLARVGGHGDGKGEETAVSPSLNEDEFAAAVRDLLRDLNDSPALQNNPLLPLMAGSSGAGQVAALRQWVIETAQALLQDPRQAKGYRALYHTYIQPAPTQEKAAELLDLPFSTYRRHLRTGVEQLTGLLWLNMEKTGGAKSDD